MARDFFPRRDGDVATWTKNFLERVSVDPPSMGLTVEQVDHLAELRALFVSKLTLTQQPATKTVVAVGEKNRTRTDLEAHARQLARIVRASPGVTSETRVLLGLSVRGPGRGSTIGVPTDAPAVVVPEVNGRVVILWLSESVHVFLKRKPRGVSKALIFQHVGENAPPADSKQWRFVLSSSHTTVRVPFYDGSLPPGTKVWFAAAWTNPRGQQGPMGNPVYAYLSGGILFKPTLKAG